MQELRGILDRSGRFMATRAATQPLPLSPFDAAISRAFTAGSQVSVPVGQGEGLYTLHNICSSYKGTLVCVITSPLSDIKMSSRVA